VNFKSSSVKFFFLLNVPTEQTSFGPKIRNVSSLTFVDFWNNFSSVENGGGAGIEKYECYPGVNSFNSTTKTMRFSRITSI
jgi:hypothetical protein